MKIIDNCFTPSLLNQIKTQIFDTSTPWHFVKTTFNDPSTESLDYKYSWVHSVSIDEKPTSHLFNIIYPELVNLLVKHKEKFNKIIRIRLGLITATDTQIINDAHVDSEISHKVGLIYLNTSNAPTYIYKEKFNQENGINVLDYISRKYDGKLTTLHESPCIENRAILFDGMYYHSSTTPTDVPRRIVINFNYC